MIGSKFMSEIIQWEGKKKGRVMIVDDEEFCLSSMKAIIKQAGFDVNNKVDECITGQEAVNLLEKSLEHGITYSIIFIDFNMPMMDGLEATSRMRKLMLERGIELDD